MHHNDKANVLDCEAHDCLYNVDGRCVTYAITVGGDEPCCDTFMAGKTKGGISGINAFVGACHVADCKFNNQFECSANGIHVSVIGGHPDCGTYKTR